MPEASIVITAKDRFSDAMKTMKDSGKAFDKSLDGLQGKLDSLNRTKASLKVDADKARQELRAAEKQFAATGEAMDDLEGKQLAFENARRNLALVSKEAANVERQMLKTGDALSKTENRAGGGLGQLGTALGAMAKAGGIQLAGQAASQWANTLAGSLGGDNVGTLFSGALSGAASGAAIGSIIPGVGTAIGAAVGGGLGLITSGAQMFEKKDDAFQSYIQEAVEGQLSAQDQSLVTGSGIAAGRETDKISFSTLFKSEETADQYLADLVEMSNNTPFLYGDLTAMSKTLATYGYDAEGILPVLQTVGDAGAALGQSTGDMNTVATALGRMKSSGKTSLEYLNMLNDRGIGAVGMLAEAKGVDQGTMYDMISKGQIAGGEAVQIILDAMAEAFSGSMEAQSKTFSGLTSTVEGLTQELDNAMGEGYNEGREAGLTAQRDWLSGESGEALKEANRAIGAWQAELENEKERYRREAMDAMMSSAEYQAAKEAGDTAEMGRLIMEAEIQGMNEYNASEGAQMKIASEKALIQSVRTDTVLQDEYYNAGLIMGEEFSRGIAAARAQNRANEFGQEAIDNTTSSMFNPLRTTPENTSPSSLLKDWKPNAAGIDYVPYDNFPALLHQGERVQTAVEARSQRETPAITLAGTYHIREEADIPKVASELLAQLELAGMRG